MRVVVMVEGIGDLSEEDNGVGVGLVMLVVVCDENLIMSPN
jgi:hypothetical protein